MTEPTRASDALKNLLLLTDIKDKHPKYSSFIDIAKSYSKKENLPQDEIDGRYDEYIGVKSVLVPEEEKENALEKLGWQDINSPGTTYFEDGKYHTGEEFEQNGIELEIIYNTREFDGIDLRYFEPSDRLIKYLKLHRQDQDWIDPYNEDPIIKMRDKKLGEHQFDTSLSIRRSELKEYLAARKCGLLLLRFSQRGLKSSEKIRGLPNTFRNKSTKYGRHNWIAGESEFDEGYDYHSSLWERFWIEPASKPRRWDAKPFNEFEKEVRFVLGDGEESVFEEDLYFEVLSFNASLLDLFIENKNRQIDFHSLSTLSINFPDNRTLQGCINKAGQFQSFFGQIAKLDIKKQRELAGFSEVQKDKISDEYFRVTIEAKFPKTRPLPWILSNCLETVNRPWSEKFDETLLLTPDIEDINPKIIIGPTSNKFSELADIMLELRKVIIPEGSIDAIKADFDYSTNNYENMRSIAFTRLFFESENDEQGSSYILDAINDLRNCKSHPKDILKVLKKHDVPTDTPRKSFLFIIYEFIKFLNDFKILTKKSVGELDTNEDKYPEDPWRQLSLAEHYLKELLEYEDA